IGAWNGAPGFFGAKVATAIAVGCTVVYKPSEKSPIGLLQLGDLVREAGYPPGVINILSGGGKTGAMLASHMDINKISFTGSLFTGKKIQEAAAQSNLKRVVLELGGKSPSLIFDDADMENALQHHSQNFLFNSGQACVAASRVFVHENIASTFIEQLKAQFEQISQAIGSPLDPKTVFGPLADTVQYDRVMSFLEIGKQEAELITGGQRHGFSKNGFYVEPTIFLNPKDDARIYREEIFGPVLAIRTFRTEEEAVKLANDTMFGLSACIYTASTSRALRIAKQIDAGNVNINSSQTFHIGAPFGGYKQSGLGREGGRQGLMHFVEAKTISIK
ncbi:ALDH-like protein, partial [Periconia macrospinosa]